MTLPSGFINQMLNLLGEETEQFLLAMQQPPVTSVRMNRRKPGAEFPEGTPVKWCSCGLYLPERPSFTLDPLLHAGAYYVQDASSMIYHEVVTRLSLKFNEESGADQNIPLALLDMCAAPGGKSSAMIDALPDGSRIVANEYGAKRAAILKENIAKWGYPNVAVTNLDSSRFAQNGDSFDIVAVDAPCSGEGMMRKDATAIAQWSPELIRDCAALQKEILKNAAEAVKPGGFLIYSTCTFNRIENEENAEFIANELRFEPYDMEFPAERGTLTGTDPPIPVYRFMPHKTRGEGLFLSVFRKPGIWNPSNLATSMHKPLKSHVKADMTKQKAALPKHKQSREDVPDIEEVLAVDFDRTRFPEADVDLPTALSYLRRESVVLPSDIPRGIVTITYKGLPLGMAKNIGTRANNLYPKNWRILMQ